MRGGRSWAFSEDVFSDLVGDRAGTNRNYVERGISTDAVIRLLAEIHGTELRVVIRPASRLMGAAGIARGKDPIERKKWGRKMVNTV